MFVCQSIFSLQVVHPFIFDQLFTEIHYNTHHRYWLIVHTETSPLPCFCFFPWFLLTIVVSWMIPFISHSLMFFDDLFLCWWLYSELFNIMKADHVNIVIPFNKTEIKTTIMLLHKFIIQSFCCKYYEQWFQNKMVLYQCCQLFALVRMGIQLWHSMNMLIY